MHNHPLNLHSAFYKFVAVAEPSTVAARVRAVAHGLLGSVIVAGEGINGTLAGTREDVLAFEATLKTDALLAPLFADMPCKHSSWTTPPFARLKVSVKPKIVAIEGIDTAVNNKNTIPAAQITVISPEIWRETIARDDVVVLDNRNHFEYRLGKFANAIDPSVSHFKNFPHYVAAHAEAWKREGKTVAMYCTGGIRCERTSAWVASLGLPCVELEGGILNYFARMPDAEHDWQGECYVFDNRVALDTHLNETPTTAPQVFAGLPDEAWRLARAERLEAAADMDTNSDVGAETTTRAESPDCNIVRSSD
jgi:UPF0176 protein